jgi:hypothetical protein
MSSNENKEMFEVAGIMNFPAIMIISIVLLTGQSEYYLLVLAIILTIILFSMMMWLVFDIETLLVGNICGLATTLLPNLIALMFVVKYELNEYIYLITPLIYLCLYIILREKEITNERYKKIDNDYKLQKTIKDLNISYPISNIDYLNIMNIKENREYKCSKEYISNNFN